MTARRHDGGCRSGSLANCLEQTFTLKKLTYSGRRGHSSIVTRKAYALGTSLSHAHGTITKADVAIAELGTDLGTKHRENDAPKRDMVEQAGRLNVR